jgi:hypothetical protein
VTAPPAQKLLDARFEFAEQPDPIPAALRPERRIPLLLLLVAKAHGSGASWKTLQLLNWTVRSPDRMELLVSLQQRSDIPDRPVVRFEPALDRALDLAMGLGLLEQKTSRAFRLTNNGKAVVGQVEESDAFQMERDLLGQLKGKLTQAEVDRVLEWREG